MELEVAERVLDAMAALAPVSRADLLYARVDLVPGHDGPTLMELERLTLDVPLLDDGASGARAADRFATAIAATLR